MPLSSLPLVTLLYSRTLICPHNMPGYPKTHVGMNGLALAIVRREDLEAFYRCYAAALKGGMRLYIVERPDREHGMRLFVDLDFKSPFRITSERAEQIAQVLVWAVGRFFPRRSLEDRGAIVCGAQYKLVHDGELIKTGIHVVWPRLFVTLDQALRIRQSVIDALEVVFGPREPPRNSWEDVVDESVYGDSGLRLLGSRKGVPCPACKTRLAAEPAAARRRHLQTNPSGGYSDCTLCGGRGRADEGRPYMPMMILHGDGTRDLAREASYTDAEDGLLRMVQDTAFRSYEPLEGLAERQGYEPPENAPLPQPHAGRTWGEPARRPGPRSEQVPRTGTSTELEFVPNLDSGTVGVSYRMVRDLLRSSQDVYSQIQVAKVRRNGFTYHVDVRGDGSLFCHNIGANHASNRIYFQINRTSVLQCCYDRDADWREKGRAVSCAHFRGCEAPVPADVRDELFPPEPVVPQLEDPIAAPASASAAAASATTAAATTAREARLREQVLRSLTLGRQSLLRRRIERFVIIREISRIMDPWLHLFDSEIPSSRGFIHIDRSGARSIKRLPLMHLRPEDQGEDSVGAFGGVTSLQDILGGPPPAPPSPPPQRDDDESAATGNAQSESEDPVDEDPFLTVVDRCVHRLYYDLVSTGLRVARTLIRSNS